MVAVQLPSREAVVQQDGTEKKHRDAPRTVELLMLNGGAKFVCAADRFE